MLHKSISDYDLMLFDTDGTYFARARNAAIGQRHSVRQALFR